MKKYLAVVLALVLAFQLASCGEKADSKSKERSNVTIKLRIVDGGGTDRLTLAGENTADLLTMDVGDAKVTIGGKAAKKEELKNGMIIEIPEDSNVQTSYPGNLFGVKSIVANESNEMNYNLTGVYLKALEDLWEKDKGLNESDVKTVSLDLSQAPGGLTSAEKSAIAWVFGAKHDVEVLEYGMDQLKKEGYVRNNRWKDGLLITIEGKGENSDSVKVGDTIKFDMNKWRSGTGAYFFTNCQAKVPGAGEKVSYSIGGEQIS